MRRTLLIAVVLIVAGCATDQKEYVRNGVAYGETDGPFRGRWWNFYERGRSFLDGGYLDEARRDFAKALDERDVDQRWARTYGLHFAPQYFPNREAGVTAFYQEDYGQAIAFLQRSHEQQPSARAAYYLRRALEATALSASDTEPPQIEIAPWEPRTATRKFVLELTALDNQYVDAIIVGGTNVALGAPAPSIDITASTPLDPGLNDISIIVRDIAGNETESTLTIVADLDGPVVSFDEMRTGDDTLSGVVFDDAGVASFRLEGVEVGLGSAQDGVSTFQIPLPALSGSTTFTAEDTLGNRSTGPVTVPERRARSHASGIQFAANATNDPLDSHRIRLAQNATAPSIRLANLADGQRYLGDEIVVDILVDAPDGIGAVTLNGLEAPVFSERRVQRLSRRIALPNEGPNEIVGVVRDRSGNQSSIRVTVHRVLTEIEAIDRKLSLAVLGNIWEGPNPNVAAEEQFVADELTRILFAENRFDLLTRELLPQILTEQELQAALGDRSGPSPLRDIVPAELMAVGMVRKDLESVEIILQAISLETSKLVGYADIAGPANTRDELQRLVQDLALRFLQEFPRVQGQILDVRRARRALASLSAADRIRPDLKCIVFREGAELRDPATGVSLGRPTEILAEGAFADVQEGFSTIRFESEALPTTTSIEVEDFVITK